MPKTRSKPCIFTAPVEPGFQTPEKRTKPRNYSPGRKSEKVHETPDLSGIKVRMFNCFA